MFQRRRVFFPFLLFVPCSHSEKWAANACFSVLQQGSSSKSKRLSKSTHDMLVEIFKKIGSKENTKEVRSLSHGCNAFLFLTVMLHFYYMTFRLLKFATQFACGNHLWTILSMKGFAAIFRGLGDCLAMAPVQTREAVCFVSELLNSNIQATQKACVWGQPRESVALTYKQQNFPDCSNARRLPHWPSGQMFPFRVVILGSVPTFLVYVFPSRVITLEIGTPVATPARCLAS